jgi:hypothetical protein
MHRGSVAVLTFGNLCEWCLGYGEMIPLGRFNVAYMKNSLCMRKFNIGFECPCFVHYNSPMFVACPDVNKHAPQAKCP